MDQSGDVLKEPLMSHQEIIARFKTVFGREMTALERKSFFLPTEDAGPSRVENG
jgi:hypothetical protein